MKRIRSTLVAACCLWAGSTLNAQDFPGIKTGDWPWWRGPNLNSVASDQPAVVEWTEAKNIVWKTAVPGRGHSSPIVVGKRVFLTTADEDKGLYSVVCYDRDRGKEVWNKVVLEGGAKGRVHKKTTLAASTLACDGERIFAAFHHKDEVWAVALDLEGNDLWRKKVGRFVSHWGYSASPTLYRSLLIIANDHKEGGAVAALNPRTGDVVWETPRPAAPTYASPIVLNVAGKDQLLLAGAEQIVSYDPLTGKPLWKAKGTSTECVSTIIAHGDRIIATGGFPDKETVCLRADGSGDVAWRVKTGDFVPSQLVHKGHVYAVLDAGVVVCWNADTGAEMWKDRLSSTVFSASPVLAGDHIYIPAEDGKTHVFRADPTKFHLVSVNELGKQAFATPAICGGRIYLRIVDAVAGKRQEMLYCIGK